MNEKLKAAAEAAVGDARARSSADLRSEWFASAVRGIRLAVTACGDFLRRVDAISASRDLVLAAGNGAYSAGARPHLLRLIAELEGGKRGAEAC